MKNSFSKAVFSFKTRILNSKLDFLYQKSEAALKAQRVSKINLEKRRALVKHALQHSSFYKEKFNGLNFNKDDFQTPQNFLKIPSLTREELQANFESIKSDDVSPSHYRKASTSGSTGFPVTILHDLRQPETPIRWRILQWWGIEPWENQAFIYRYKKRFLPRLRNKILWWPTRRIFLAAANPSAKQLNTFVHNFNRVKPSLLQGYVDVVFEFALYLLDNNIKIYPPKMVWVTSAPLFQEQRELMELAFGAPVCDQYGNTEIMLIAAECKEQKGLHIMQDTVHVEFVDENNQPVPPNTTGKILLTDLTNFAFPLIRYEIGDEGKYREDGCSCGIPLPLMDNVRGRRAVFIETPSGLSIRGEHLMAMFDGYMKVFKEIQLHQEADFSVCIYYVPRGLHQGIEEVEKMGELLKQRARSEIVVSFEETLKIKRVNKKTPLIISHLR